MFLTERVVGSSPTGGARKKHLHLQVLFQLSAPSVHEKWSRFANEVRSNRMKIKARFTSCEHSEHFMTTKLSLYVCNANTSWIEIAITFSKKSKGDTSLPALFHFTCWPKSSTLPHTAAPAVNWLGTPRCLRQMKRCYEQEETTSVATRSSSSVAPYHSLSPLAKTHSLRASSSPPNARILGHPPTRRLYFWLYASLVRVQNGLAIHKPLEHHQLYTQPDNGWLNPITILRI